MQIPGGKRQNPSVFSQESELQKIDLSLVIASQHNTNHSHRKTWRGVHQAQHPSPLTPQPSTSKARRPGRTARAPREGKSDKESESQNNQSESQHNRPPLKQQKVARRPGPTGRAPSDKHPPSRSNRRFLLEERDTIRLFSPRNLKAKTVGLSLDIVSATQPPRLKQDKVARLHGQTGALSDKHPPSRRWAGTGRVSSSPILARTPTPKP